MHVLIENKLSVLLVAFLLCSYNLFDSFVPVHDTLFRFQVFDYFYSRFYFEGEMPYWIPNGLFGIPSNFYLLTAVSPSEYVITLLGKILSFENTLILFKISAITDCLFFAYSLSLFSQLYRNIFSRIVVVYAPLFCIFFSVQGYFSFYIYYLFPAVLFLIIKTFDTRNLNFLYVAGIIEVISLFGNTPYIAAIHFLLITLIILIFLIRNKEDLKNFRVGRLGLLMTMLFIFFIYVGNVWFALQNVSSLAIGRNAHDLSVPLNVFLSYARANPFASVYGVMTGGIFNIDHNYYVGLLPLAIFFIGVAFSKDKNFRALGFCVILLWGLALGGYIAGLIYHYPLMKYYRHISHTYSVSGLLLILASGFVIQEQLEKKINYKSSVFRGGRLLAFLSMVFIDMFLTLRDTDFDTNFVTKSGIAFFIVRVFLYLAAFYYYHKNEINRRRWMLIHFFIIAYFVDLSLFYVTVVYHAPRIEVRVDAISPDQLRFYPKRAAETGFDISTSRGLWLTSIIRANPIHNAIYAFSYPWANQDPCFLPYRHDLWSTGFVVLNQLRSSDIGQYSTEGLRQSPDKFLLGALGCNTQKIRLISKYVCVSDTNEAQNRLKRIAKDDDLAVITGACESFERSDPKADYSEITITKFFSNSLELRIQGNKQKRLLYYSDSINKHWTVLVNGKTSRLYTANAAFKAVEIPPGNHDINFVYQPNIDERVLINLMPIISLLFIIIFPSFNLLLKRRRT